MLQETERVAISGIDEEQETTDVTTNLDFTEEKQKLQGKFADYINSVLFEGTSAVFWCQPTNLAKYSFLVPLVRKYHSARL
ncbi:hypothetical protein niasHT_024643 [Heterodera trifolii]|uniref:Uncharacterized protein n=1 Tax=Heterodera trifolii TaxID=157864 RepID=A0ABD2K854_9BILA